MYHRIITTEFDAVRTISPDQYKRLKADGFRVHGNGSVKTVYAPRSIYDREQIEAREFCHAEYHREYPGLACYYTGCEKAAA